MPRLDEARAPDIVVEGTSQLLDTGRERRLTDDRVAPYRTEQLGARDELAGALDQGREHGGRPRREPHLALAGPQTPAPRIEAVTTEANFPFHQPFRRPADPRPVLRRISPFSWDFARRGDLPSEPSGSTTRTPMTRRSLHDVSPQSADRSLRADLSDRSIRPGPADRGSCRLRHARRQGPGREEGRAAAAGAALLAGRKLPHAGRGPVGSRTAEPRGRGQWEGLALHAGSVRLDVPGGVQGRGGGTDSHRPRP